MITRFPQIDRLITPELNISIITDRQKMPVIERPYDGSISQND
jgi:hypothetical protein